jgi:hypothetical protein
VKLDYSNWPETKQAEFQKRRELDKEGFEQDASDSAAFAPNDSPSWESPRSWACKGLALDREFLALSPRSIVARVIYAENSNVGTGDVRKDAMLATANVIRNRMKTSGYNNNARDVVLSPGAFSCLADGNIGASNPAYHLSDLPYWLHALWLGGCLAYSIPFDNNLPNDKYLFFFDMRAGVPFAIEAKGEFLPCKASDVGNATHYLYRKSPYPITQKPYVIDSTVFFSWKDR